MQFGAKPVNMNKTFAQYFRIALLSFHTILDNEISDFPS